jgi:hypothetical protein
LCGWDSIEQYDLIKFFMDRKSSRSLFIKVILNKMKRVIFKNHFDSNFEELIVPILTEYSKAKDPHLQKSFTFLLRSIIDLGSFHYSYMRVILPTTQKQTKKTEALFKKSFYYNQLKISKTFDDAVFEVIRIGYVHLYHKYESFKTGLIECLDENLTNVFKSKISISKYLIENYKYKVDDLKSQPRQLRKINWICNCVKHKDGFPTKQNPPKEFENCNKLERIRITQKEFESDIFFLIDHFAKSFSIYSYVGVSPHAINLVEKLKKENPEYSQTNGETEKELKVKTLMMLLELMGIEEELTKN